MYIELKELEIMEATLQLPFRRKWEGWLGVEKDPRKSQKEGKKNLTGYFICVRFRFEGR
jgi:hypothetical protein